MLNLKINQKLNMISIPGFSSYQKKLINEDKCPTLMKNFNNFMSLKS